MVSAGRHASLRRLVSLLTFVSVGEQRESGGFWPDGDGRSAGCLWLVLSVCKVVALSGSSVTRLVWMLFSSKFSQSWHGFVLTKRTKNARKDNRQGHGIIAYP
jgi:hypothetical protein